MDTKSSYALTLFLTLALLTGCVAPTVVPPTPASPTASVAPTASPAQFESNVLNGCVDAYSPDVDYFPEKVQVTQATGFKVEYFKNYKVVTVLTPYRDAQETFKYLLVQCGTPTPDGYETAMTIEVPVKSIVSMSSRYLPMLKALGLYDKLVGVDSVPGIYDPDVLKMAADGRLAEVGYGAEVNVEQVVNLNPGLVMTYAGRQAQSNAHPKLLEAGVKVAINAEYMEATPLGRAEWLKFVGVFFNREAAATQYVDAMVTKYAEIAGRARQTTQKPSVLWGVPGKDTWYMPGGKSFVATLLADAGANYLWADDTSAGNMPLAFEAVFERGSNADIWLAVDSYASLAEMTSADGRLNGFAAVANNSVWTNDARINEGGGNDYWEGGLANPDVVLADLIKIFHPELSLTHELVYWRQLK